MSTATTHQEKDTGCDGVLYLALELGEATWKLAFTVGRGQRPRARTIAARELEALATEVARAQRRFGLPAAAVVSCYEAGREGFWVHRYLLAQGIRNLVVDSSSIEVTRRARRAKTDRLDARKLVEMLVRYCGGERKVWSVVHVPSVAAEDRRHLHRELATLKGERTRWLSRFKALLATQGLRLAGVRDVPGWLAQVGNWEGAPLPPGVRARLERAWAQVEQFTARIEALEAERARLLETAGADRALGMVEQLMRLRSIGINSAWVYVMELFSWRAFRNRRQLGALTGFAPTPYTSGDSHQELGISKAGNGAVRALTIEIAWMWLRYQPESALSQWYQARFGHGSKRLRRLGIVALGRKLLIELWRFLETGAVPAGAVLKP